MTDDTQGYGRNTQTALIGFLSKSRQKEEPQCTVQYHRFVMITFILGGKMAENTGKTHDTKPDNLNSISRIYVRKERANSQKLSLTSTCTL